MRPALLGAIKSTHAHACTGAIPLSVIALQYLMLPNMLYKHEVQFKVLPLPAAQCTSPTVC